MTMVADSTSAKVLAVACTLGTRGTNHGVRTQ